MRGQSRDSGFLSHNMPAQLLRDIGEACSGGLRGAPVLRVVEAIVKAAKARQRVQPEARPMELESPSSLIVLCDTALLEIDETDMGSRCGPLYLRGTISSSVMDFQGAAEDLRAAYMASDGRAPWILQQAAWCTASSGDSQTGIVPIGNYQAAEATYNDILVYLDPLAKGDAVPLHIMVNLTFVLWELAQVVLWQYERLALFSPSRIKSLNDLLSRASECKRRAVAAERHLEASGGGIMNCYARESVLDALPSFGVRQRARQGSGASTTAKASQKAEQERAAALAAETRNAQEERAAALAAEAAGKTEEDLIAVLGAVATQATRRDEDGAVAEDPNTVEDSAQEDDFFSAQEEDSAQEDDLRRMILRGMMQEVPCARNREDASARVRDAALKYMAKRESERASPSAMGMTALAETREQMLLTEAGMREQQAAFNAREKSLAAQEQKTQRHEIELASLRANWETLVTELRGQSDLCAERAERERQCQAERFRADMKKLAAERDVQVKALRTQLADVEAHCHQDLAELHKSKQDVEAELASVFGALTQEEDLQPRADVLAAQQAALSERERELGRLQNVLWEEQAQLEQRRAEFAKEREALKQLRGNSIDSLQKSGGQVRKLQEVRVHELRYCQNNVGRCFQDGRRLDETVRKLHSGEVAAGDFPRLRVVSYMDLLWSLDNRRLKCLKEAFPEHTPADTTITAQLEPLTDKTIAREFQKKFTVGKTVEQRR